MYVSQSSLWDYLAYYLQTLKEVSYFQVITVFIELIWQYLPYIISSILISALIALFLTPKRMEKVFKFSRLGSIGIAALLGAISPLSSYALIPFAGALMGLGFPIGPITAFVLSTPLMNPTIFILTLRGLGIEMALARTIATIGIGILSGVFSELLFGKSLVAKEKTPLKMPKTRAFLPYVYSMAKYMSKAFLLAIFLASVVRVYLKAEFVASFFGADKPWSISLAALLGIPFYTCGGASIPVVSSLIDLGMADSAALAFFIAGPATNIPNVSAVFLTFKWRYLVFYLAVSLALAVVSGYLYGVWQVI